MSSVSPNAVSQSPSTTATSGLGTANTAVVSSFSAQNAQTYGPPPNFGGNLGISNGFGNPNFVGSTGFALPNQNSNAYIRHHQQPRNVNSGFNVQNPVLPIVPYMPTAYQYGMPMFPNWNIFRGRRDAQTPGFPQSQPQPFRGPGKSKVVWLSLIIINEYEIHCNAM